MSGFPNYDGYFEPKSDDPEEGQLTAIQIAELFNSDNFRNFTIDAPGIPDPADITEMIFYSEADDEGPRCVYVEYHAQDQIYADEIQHSTGQVELVPEEKFNFWYWK